MFFIPHSEEIGVLEAKDSDNSRSQLQKLVVFYYDKEVKLN